MVCFSSGPKVSTHFFSVNKPGDGNISVYTNNLVSIADCPFLCLRVDDYKPYKQGLGTRQELTLCRAIIVSPRPLAIIHPPATTIYTAAHTKTHSPHSYRHVSLSPLHIYNLVLNVCFCFVFAQQQGFTSSGNGIDNCTSIIMYQAYIDTNSSSTTAITQTHSSLQQPRFVSGGFTAESWVRLSGRLRGRNATMIGWYMLYFYRISE